MEVLVALVVAEVAALGALGLAAAALNQLSGAAALEDALVRVHALQDSLSGAASVGGSDSAGGRVVSWSADSLGVFTITATIPGVESFRIVGARRE